MSSAGFCNGARIIFLVCLMAAALISCSGGSSSVVDVSTITWTDPKAATNTYTFWKTGICEAKYQYRTYAGRWTQSGKNVTFTISGDSGETVFHMILGENEMDGDAFPPGGQKSIFVNLVPTQPQTP